MHEPGLHVGYLIMIHTAMVRVLGNSGYYKHFFLVTEVKRLPWTGTGKDSSPFGPRLPSP